MIDPDEHILLPWFSALLDSRPKMALLALCSFLCLPVVLLFGALFPLFRKWL